MFGKYTSKAVEDISAARTEQAVGEIAGIRKGCVAAFAAADPRSGSERLVVVAEDPVGRHEEVVGLRVGVEARHRGLQVGAERVEIALALKFLSVADMTMHWGILKYELFMGLWVVIFALMTLYLFGFIKFPHDSPLKKLSPTRWIFSLGSLALTIYLATGFFINEKTDVYNSLKLMSGLAPPATYNILLPEPEVDPLIKAKYSSYTKCANNLDCFKDYH